MAWRRSISPVAKEAGETGENDPETSRQTQKEAREPADDEEQDLHLQWKATLWRKIKEAKTLSECLRKAG